MAATGPAVAAAGAWSQVPVPDADVQFTSLQSVDGRTDTDGWAVGYVQPPTATPTYPISLHWTGTAWTSVPVPLEGIGTTLWGVSGSATDDAWAVGSVSTHRTSGRCRPGPAPRTPGRSATRPRSHPARH